MNDNNNGLQNPVRTAVGIDPFFRPGTWHTTDRTFIASLMTTQHGVKVVSCEVSPNMPGLLIYYLADEDHFVSNTWREYQAKKLRIDPLQLRTMLSTVNKIQPETSTPNNVCRRCRKPTAFCAPPDWLCSECFSKYHWSSSGMGGWMENNNAQSFGEIRKDKT